MTDYRAQHDPLCALLKQEKCHGIGGTDWGHYLDQPVCRNCGTRCDCARVREIRAALAMQLIESARAESEDYVALGLSTAAEKVAET